jgi:hypothetical protein
VSLSFQLVLVSVSVWVAFLSLDTRLGEKHETCRIQIQGNVYCSLLITYEDPNQTRPNQTRPDHRPWRTVVVVVVGILLVFGRQ